MPNLRIILFYLISDWKEVSQFPYKNKEILVYTTEEQDQ